jgi:hypothetical protein
MQTISILQAVFGVAMLTLGRKLYWLFVGGIGFAIGFSLAANFLGESSIITLLVIGLVFGVLAGLASILMNRLVIGIAGFVVGGYLATQLVALVNLPSPLPGWLVFLVGGAFCAVLVAFLFNWALILLTSLVGAALLVQLLNASDPLSLAILVILTFTGFFLQARILRRK